MAEDETARVQSEARRRFEALQAFPTLRHPERVKPWLFQILRRLATDRYRSERREVQAENLEDLERFSLYDLIWEEDTLPLPDASVDVTISNGVLNLSRRKSRVLAETLRSCGLGVGSRSPIWSCTRRCPRRC